MKAILFIIHSFIFYICYLFKGNSFFDFIKNNRLMIYLTAKKLFIEEKETFVYQYRNSSFASYYSMGEELSYCVSEYVQTYYYEGYENYNQYHYQCVRQVYKIMKSFFKKNPKEVKRIIEKVESEM